MPVIYNTREEWLVAAVEALRPLFTEAGAEIPAVRVSVGWPGGRGKKATVIGQCWPTAASAAKAAEVFISPTQDDAVRVLDVLTHELVHAVDDCQNGHRGPFAKLAKALGLTGKMTATVAGPELAEKLAGIAGSLGDYPHAKLISLAGGVEGPKKQAARMLKLECPVDGYIVRTTAKWLEVGVPACPCGSTMERAA